MSEEGGGKWAALVLHPPRLQLKDEVEEVFTRQGL